MANPDPHKATVSGHVYIGASLDGFIARRDGDIEWLTKYATADEDYGYGAFIKEIDGIVLGRGTFERVLSFDSWPYEKPVVVASRSLSQHDLRDDLAGRVRIAATSPADLLARLYREGWRRAYIDGGKLIQSFLREGLIDDLVLTRVPILLGDGVPLFGSLPSETALSHVQTVVFPSGLVQSRYKILGGAR